MKAKAQGVAEGKDHEGLVSQGGAVRKAPTIRDVAAAAGVSVSVVSRVLNPDSGPVAPAKRQEVLRVIEELGYRPGPQRVSSAPAMPSPSAS